MRIIETKRLNVDDDIDTTTVPNLGRPTTDSTVAIDEYIKSIDDNGWLEIEEVRESEPDAEPIMVWQISKTISVKIGGEDKVLQRGSYILIDGGHRVQALREINARRRKNGEQPVTDTVLVEVYEFDSISEAIAYSTGANKPKRNLAKSDRTNTELDVNVTRVFCDYNNRGEYVEYQDKNGKYSSKAIQSILYRDEYAGFELSDSDIVVEEKNEKGKVVKRAGRLVRYVRDNWYKERDKACWAPKQISEVRDIINRNYKKLGFDAPVNFSFLSPAGCELSTGYTTIDDAPCIFTILKDNDSQNYAKLILGLCNGLNERQERGELSDDVDLTKLKRFAVVYRKCPWNGDSITSLRKQACQQIYRNNMMIKSKFGGSLGTKLYGLGQRPNEKAGELRIVDHQGNSSAIGD